MHKFDELVSRSIQFSMHTLDRLQDETTKELDTSGATRFVKTLQAISLQRVIISVGIMSVFEADLQDRIGCEDGFQEARKILKAAGEMALEERFGYFIAAVNVLKHGRGPSYNKLISKIDSLPFRIKRSPDECFSEGDVAEVSTLVEVDSQFVLNCVQIVREVSGVVREQGT